MRGLRSLLPFSPSWRGPAEDKPTVHEKVQTEPPRPTGPTATPGAPAGVAPSPLLAGDRPPVDRNEFESVVADHQAVVFGYLRARLAQPTDAEDLTQEVFLRCYQGWQRYDSNSAIRPWLIGIARNLLYEHTRKLKRRREVAWTELCLELEEMMPGSGDHPAYDDVLTHLPMCLESLGESARQALEMKYSAKLRLAEIGEKLRRSEGAIKILMFRARQALKVCLDGKLKAKTHE